MNADALDALAPKRGVTRHTLSLNILNRTFRLFKPPAQLWRPTSEAVAGLDDMSAGSYFSFDTTPQPSHDFLGDLRRFVFAQLTNNKFHWTRLVFSIIAYIHFTKNKFCFFTHLAD